MQGMRSTEHFQIGVIYSLLTIYRIPFFCVFSTIYGTNLQHPLYSTRKNTMLALQAEHWRTDLHALFSAQEAFFPFFVIAHFINKSDP